MIYRDNNIDNLRRELDLKSEALVLAQRENRLLSHEKQQLAIAKKRRKPFLGSLVTLASIGAGVYTGSGWFIFLAILSLDSISGGASAGNDSDEEDNDG